MTKKQEIQQIVGAALIALGLIAGIVGTVYALTGAVSANLLRWWATAATLALPLAGVIVWRLATNAAREHLRGHERGVSDAEKAIQVVGRGLSATASMARTTAKPKAGAAPDYNDLLPRVGQMKIVDEPRGSGEVIDL